MVIMGQMMVVGSFIPLTTFAIKMESIFLATIMVVIALSELKKTYLGG